MGSLEIDYKQIVLENVTSTFVIIKFMNAQTLKVLVNTASVGAKTIFVKNIQHILYIHCCGHQNILTPNQFNHRCQKGI